MRRVPLLAVLLLALAATQMALGQGQVRVSELTPNDLQFMSEQRQLINDLAALNLGRQLSGERERDLALLQALLDRGLVRSDQTRELQAMGVVLGDLLAADLDMHWVLYQDGAGRSRALRYGETDEFLFPVTMISRRREAGNETPVAEIYAKAAAIIEVARPDLPFQ